MRRNQNDFHQFSWSPAFSDIIFIDESSLFAPMAAFLFLNLKSWYQSCLQPANFAEIYFHSLGKPPHHKGKKTHTIVFTGQNFVYN